MFVKDFMTRHPIMVSPEMAATEAQKIMFESHVRHLPVVGDGKRLLGLVTRQTLTLQPELLGSLDVWEITRYLSNLTVGKIMVKDVVTIDPGRTAERAARTMTDHKIGCMPVVENNVVIGIITEIDLLSAFQEMLGLPFQGIRVTMRMPDRAGEFAKLSAVLGENGMGVMGIGTYPSPRHEGFYDAVLKIRGVDMANVETALGQIPDQEIVDIRDVV